MEQHRLQGDKKTENFLVRPGSQPLPLYTCRKKEGSACKGAKAPEAPPWVTGQQMVTCSPVSVVMVGRAKESSFILVAPCHLQGQLDGLEKLEVVTSEHSLCCLYNCCWHGSCSSVGGAEAQKHNHRGPECIPRMAKIRCVHTRMTSVFGR